MLLRIRFNSEGEIMTLDVDRNRPGFEGCDWEDDELGDVIQIENGMVTLKEFDKVIRIDSNDSWEDISGEFDHGTFFDRRR